MDTLQFCALHSYAGDPFCDARQLFSSIRMFGPGPGDILHKINRSINTNNFNQTSIKKNNLENLMNRNKTQFVCLLFIFIEFICKIKLYLKWNFGKKIKVWDVRTKEKFVIRFGLKKRLAVWNAGKKLWSIRKIVFAMIQDTRVNPSAARCA